MQEEAGWGTALPKDLVRSPGSEPPGKRRGATQEQPWIPALLRLGAEQAWRRGLSRSPRDFIGDRNIHNAKNTRPRLVPGAHHALFIEKLCWPSSSLPSPSAPHFPSHTQPALCGRSGTAWPVSGQSRFLTPHPPKIPPGSHLSPLVIESCQLFGPLGVWGQPSPRKQTKKQALERSWPLGPKSSGLCSEFSASTNVSSCQHVASQIPQDRDLQLTGGLAHVPVPPCQQIWHPSSSRPPLRP